MPPIGKFLVLAALAGPVWSQELPDSIADAQVGEWARYRVTLQVSIDGLPNQPTPAQTVIRQSVAEVSPDQVVVESLVEKGKREGRTTRDTIDLADATRDRLIQDIFQEASHAGGDSKVDIEILEESIEPTTYPWNAAVIRAHQIRVKSRTTIEILSTKSVIEATLEAIVSREIPIEGIIERKEIIRRTSGGSAATLTTHSMKLQDFGTGG